MSASACECTRGMPWRVAKSSALTRSRRMTATKADPFAFWNPGPLLTSATSPQPIMPQRTVRRIDIVIVDTTLGRGVRERGRLELPGGRPPLLFGNTFCRISSRLPNGGPVLFDRNFRTPYVQQWMLSVQREVIKDTIVEVAYVGNKGTKLYRDYNRDPKQWISRILPHRGGGGERRLRW